MFFNLCDAAKWTLWDSEKDLFEHIQLSPWALATIMEWWVALGISCKWLLKYYGRFPKDCWKAPLFIVHSSRVLWAIRAWSKTNYFVFLLVYGIPMGQVLTLWLGQKWTQISSFLRFCLLVCIEVCNANMRTLREANTWGQGCICVSTKQWTVL